MATDPTISLGVRGGGSGPMQAGYAPPQTNPLDLVGQVVDTQLKVKKLKAQQVAGQIIAASPDMGAAVSQMQQNPLVSMFPDLISSYASANQTLTATAGEVQRQGNEAYDHVLKNLPLIAKNPEKFDSAIIAPALALSSPMAKPGLERSLNLMKQAWTQGPDGSPLSPDQINQNMTSALMSTGGLESIPFLYGRPATRQVGDQIISGTEMLPGNVYGEKPGTFRAASTNKMGIPPQLTQAGAIPFGGSSGGGNGVAPPSAAPPSAGLAVPAAASPPISAVTARDGKPLFPAGYSIKAPTNSNVVGGVPIGPAATIATRLAEKYGSSKVLDDGQALLGQLTEMDADLDNMQKGGGWTAPGPAADSRAKLAAALNLGSTMLGGKAIADPTSVASAEGFIKASQLSSVGTTTLMLGAQREAAETLSNMAKAVPSLNNSYLGAKLLIGLRRAYTNRAMDQYKWETEHALTNGNLTGVDQKFVEAHPISGYINPILQDNGLAEAAGKAYQQKMITREEFKKIMGGFSQVKE